MSATTFSLIVAIQAAAIAPDGVMTPPRFPTGLPIVQDGRGCTIVYPAGDPAWRELADAIAAGIKSLGATAVPLLADTEAIPERLGQLPTRLADQRLILLGDLNSNRAIFPYYANYYTYCDASYPGGDGYVLQTVVRPFGRAVNTLIVGAATVEGGLGGTHQLLTHLSRLEPATDVELPYCLDVKLGPQLQALMEPVIRAAFEQDPSPPPATMPAGSPDEQARDAIDYGVARDRFTSYAHLYFYTGRRDLAERARDWGVHLASRNEEGIRIADYTMENLAAAWRRVSPAPVFTAEQRQQIDTRMYETVVKNATAWWCHKGPIPEIGGRHHTTGMLAWWTLIRCVLEVGEPDTAARAQLEQWKRDAEGYLDGLLRHYWDDLDDYQSADSAQNTASYALQRGKLEWYRDGLARRAAEKLLSLTDNLGWYVGVQGYGEALPGWERFTLDGGLLLGSCGFVYQDGGYQWVLDRFPGLASSWGALQPWGLHQYAMGDAVRAEEPGWLTGMQVLRLTPYRVNLLNDGVFLRSPLMDGFAVAGLRPPEVSQDLAYDKVVLRSSAARDGVYLLLQGMSGIALSTIDMNAVIRYTDAGKLWLVHNTGRMSLFFKNAVYISNGLNDQALPAACELVARAQADDLHTVSSRLPDYRGTDWIRNVLSVGDRFTLIIDQIKANKPDEYLVSCNWRTPGWAQIEDNGWVARQDEATFHLLPGEMTGLESKRFSSNDGATRPTVLRQHRRFKAAPGESLFFENLLYTDSPDKQQHCEIRRIAPGVIAVRAQDRTGERKWIAFAGQAGVDLPGLRTDAAAGILSADAVLLSNATHARIGELTEKHETPQRMLLKPADPAELNALIEKMWSQAAGRSAEAHASNTAEAAKKGPAARWTFADLSSRGARIDGIHITQSRNLQGSTLLVTDGMLPTLVAEPRLSPQAGSGLAFVPAKHVQRSEQEGEAGGSDLQPVLAPLAGAELTIGLPGRMQVTELLLIGAAGGEIGTPMPPGPLKIELTFSIDGFAQDRRTRTLTLQRETRHFTLYKGHAYAFENYRAGDMNELASALHVRFIEGPGQSMALNDLQVRAAGPVGTQPTELRVIDLNADGDDELMSWIRDGEFALLDAAGMPLWQRDFESGIVAVDAWDLEDDGRKEIFISLTNWNVMVFNLDGSVRWQVNWEDMKKRTDGRQFGDGSIVYGMGAWQTQERPDKQVLLTSYYYAARLDSRGNLLDSFRRSGHVTQIREIPAGLPNAGALVTRSDIPWTGPVPLEWLDPATGTSSASINVPNGPAVLVEVDDYDGDKQPEAIVATEQGIGLYSPRQPNQRWEHLAEAALTGAAVIESSPGEPARFVYARQDGYLFVVDINGRILKQLLLDAPVQCLAALPAKDGTWVAVVGTSDDLRCIRLSDLREMWRLPGVYQSVSPLRRNGAAAVTAITRSGEIRCLDAIND